MVPTKRPYILARCNPSLKFLRTGLTFTRCRNRRYSSANAFLRKQDLLMSSTSVFLILNYFLDFAGSESCRRSKGLLGFTGSIRTRRQLSGLIFWLNCIDLAGSSGHVGVLPSFA